MIVVAVLAGVVPVATWVHQENELDTSRRSLAYVTSQNKQLTERAALLQTDEAVARVAREQLGMVPAGKEAYAITNLRPGLDAISERPILDKETLDAPALTVAPRRSAWRQLVDAARFWD
jgi:cell division protein FtsB